MKKLIVILMVFASCSSRSIPYEVEKVKYPIMSKIEIYYVGEHLYFVKSDTVTIAVSKKTYKKAKIGKELKMLLVRNF